MAYLQLADNSTMTRSRPVEDYYVRVPTNDGGSILVREDYFDDLPDEQWTEVMEYLEEGFGMNGIFSKLRERKERKQQRKDLRTKSKAEARIRRSEGGGLLTKITGAVGNVMEKIKGPASAEVDTGGYDVSYDRGQEFSVKKKDPSDKQWYQKPEIMIPVGLVLIGGTVMAIRSMRN